MARLDWPRAFASSLYDASKQPLCRSASRQMRANRRNAPSDNMVKARPNDAPAANQPDDSFRLNFSFWAEALTASFMIASYGSDTARMRSSHNTVNWFSASFQWSTWLICHFAVAFFNAR